MIIKSVWSDFDHNKHNKKLFCKLNTKFPANITRNFFILLNETV